MDSIMNKLEAQLNDKSSLGAEFIGKQIEIKCDKCNKTVKTTVSENLTGKCPLCHYENAIRFAVK